MINIFKAIILSLHDNKFFYQSMDTFSEFVFIGIIVLHIYIFIIHTYLTKRFKTYERERTCARKKFNRAEIL